MTKKFPSKLREKLTSTTQTLTAEDKKGTGARTDRQCPECQQQKLTFSQAQLRSADEGTTIFYFCLGCGHR
jgi:DNA-directed RNA polymerase I subunit RPA12